jgi:hypothetical protein
MIDDEIRLTLLAEIRKSGNVSLSCLKVNIDHATYYRWKKTDKDFRKKAMDAERYGRKNNCDVAEHVLMLLIKSKDLNAVKYYLGHNSQRYKPKMTNAIIYHKTDRNLPENKKEPRTLEDLLIDTAKERQKQCLAIKRYYMKMDGIPPKADGTPISDNELREYEVYIHEWYKKKIADEARERGDPPPKFERPHINTYGITDEDVVREEKDWKEDDFL